QLLQFCGHSGQSIFISNWACTEIVRLALRWTAETSVCRGDLLPAIAMREFMSKNIKRVVSERVETIVGQHDGITALIMKRWKRRRYLSYSGGGKAKGRAVPGKAFCLLGGRCCLAAHDPSTPSGVRHLTGKSRSPACAIDTAVVSRASTAKRTRIIRPIGIACRSS